MGLVGTGSGLLMSFTVVLAGRRKVTPLIRTNHKAFAKHEQRRLPYVRLESGTDAKGHIREVRVKGVKQVVSAEMPVIPETDPYGSVRPVLPGMLCYPPEQVVGPYSDVYGFGRTCYDGLLGCPVPDDREEQTLPGAWRLLLSEATARMPQHRIQDFATVLERLKHFPDQGDSVAG